MNPQRCIDAATACALSASGTRNNRIRLGAALYVKRRLVAVGSNSYKTHPILKTYSAFPHLHAEQDAIIRAGIDNCRGGIIAVARVKADGSPGLAKPCPICQAFGKDAGIRAFLYTDDDGCIHRMDLY